MWDLIKAGVAIASGTYLFGMLYMALIGVAAIGFALVVLAIVKLAEGVSHVARRISKKISNRKDAKQRRT